MLELRTFKGKIVAIFCSLAIASVLFTYFIGQYITLYGVENLINILAGSVLGFIICTLFAMRFILKIVDQFLKNTHDLSTLIKSIQDSSSKTGASAEEVARSASEQASAVQETVSTLHEITEMVSRGADNATSAFTKSKSSVALAKNGKEEVVNVIHAIDEIKATNERVIEQIKNGNENLNDILEMINNISEKTKLINSIVFQTKLLAFNAAVEAARAGEHGKGFAVVAEEVGSLATMSGSASKEIEELVESGVKLVKNALETSKSQSETLIQDTADKTTYGVEVANRCSDVLEEIVVQASDVQALMENISSATKEQEEGIRNIVDAMSSLDRGIHENSNNATATLSFVKELEKASSQLEIYINNLDSLLLGQKKSQLDLESKEVMCEISEVESSIAFDDEESFDSSSNIDQKKIEIVEQSNINQDIHDSILHNEENEVVEHNLSASLGEIPSADDERFEDF